MKNMNQFKFSKDEVNKLSVALSEFYAKSSGETIREHTDKLLEALEVFQKLYGKYFDEKTLLAIRYACEYHDYGKMCYIVQKMLKNKNMSFSKEMDQFYTKLGFSNNVVPHGYLSPVFMNYKALKEELGEKLTRCLYTAVYYHHSRTKEIESVQIKEIVQNDLSRHFERCAVKYKQYLFNKEISDDDWVQYAVLVGMLNKFDYYASDNKEKLPIEMKGSDKGQFLSNYVYQSFLEKKREMRPVQKYMLAHQQENLIVIASTGIGKTEAALLWAGDSKLFYTLPLKVSINTMFERISKDYQYDKNKVTLLHSDCLSILTQDDIFEDAIMKYDASKRFSYPVTVCTIDQLFSFVYKYRGSEILLATLKYSKLIIDEIQSYEPKVIAKLIYGLSLVTKAGGKFVIITATLPPVLTYFIDTYVKIPHLLPEKFLLTENIRHKIHYEKQDTFDYKRIAELGRYRKVLVICNTVKGANEVYEQLHNRDGLSYVKLIHAKFMRQHLRMLEEAIKKFAGNEGSGENRENKESKTDKDRAGIWISTQIVEASLDLDFDVLFTEMCTADSLLQRMGRCYRKRNYTKDEPNVYIVDNGNGYKTVYQKDIYDRSVEFLMRYQEQFFEEAQKIDYVEQVYKTEDLKEGKSEYFQEIEKEIQNCQNIFPFDMSKEEAKKRLRGIISYKVIPESEYRKNCDLLKEQYEILRKRGKSSVEERLKATQILEDFSVNLGNYDYRAVEKSNSIFAGLQYYTTNYKYDFDEDNLCGKGLEYYKDEDLNWV